jgi:hypothetical protein
LHHRTRIISTNRYRNLIPIALPLSLSAEETGHKIAF